jgi:hypothetical protein
MTRPVRAPADGEPSALRSSRDQLTTDELLEAAERETGLSDWGADPSFRAGLDQLVAEVNGGALAPPVEATFTAHVVGQLATRLRLREDERQHPEITTAPIERPVILIGLARTGTTILHDLMQLDPAARAPREWETANPWPAPEIATFDTDPRIAATQVRFDQLLQAAPQLRTMHEFGAALPSDCLNMMMPHFTCASFWSRYALDGYAEWLATTPAEGVYRTHRRVLQELQWKGPRGRWTLKEPTHQLNLDLLAAAYPDACFVQTHRDPVRTIASASSLVHTIQSLSKPDRDPHATGRAARTLFGACIDRSTAVRDADPALDARILDVAYADTVLDPVGQVRRIHEHFDLPFTDEHARRIEEHMSRRTETGHGRHSYTPEDFGHDPAELQEAFSRYRECFGHLLAEPTRA